MCRFINSNDFDVASETLDDITDKNLFSYCDNNPVMRADDGGDFWHIVVGAVVGAGINAISTVIDNKINKKALTTGLGMSVLTGAISGGFGASGVGILGQMAVNACVEGALNVREQYTRNKKIKGLNLKEVAAPSLVGAAAGALGGRGSGTKNIGNLEKRLNKRVINSVGKKGMASTTKKAIKYYAKNSRRFYKNTYSFGKNIKSIVSSSGINYVNDSLGKRYD